MSEPDRRPPRKASSAPRSPIALYRTAIVAGAIGIAALIVGFILLQSGGGKSYACESLLTPPPHASAHPNAVGFATENLGRGHVAPPGARISYRFCPPTSGRHWNAASRGPMRYAVYPATSEQPPGGWVHNLEHGGVALLYRCPRSTLGSTDCATAEEMALMQTWFDAAPVVNDCQKQALVARFDEMSTRFAVVAWNRALLLDTFELGQASTFAQQWTDSAAAPESQLC